MPRATARGRRRTWPQRLLIAVNSVALVGALATAGTLAYSNDRLSRLDRVNLDGVTAAGDVAPSDPQNYLIVGVDDASGLSEGDSVRNRDEVVGLHTDTIMVMRVDPKAALAQLVSLPRDLWVPIAETDSNQRINVALATGGPRRLIKTIDEQLGIPIHHYIQIDFAGFRQLVELVDGIPVQFPRAARAASSGLSIEAPGCWTLGPVQALGFSRARTDYQVRDDDEWHTDPGADYSRVGRQQLLVQLALRRAIAKGARDPATLRRLIDLGVGTVRVDDALEGGTLVALGRQFRDFRPEELVTHSLPTTEDTVGGAAVLILREEAAEPTLAIFRGVAPVAPGSIVASDVTVEVRNGTQIAGQARSVTADLTDAGFEALVPGDAPPDQQGQPTTVFYAAGAEAKAQLVARHLAGPVRFELEAERGDADAVVVTGTDWEGVAPSARPVDEVPAPSSAPTTSTVAPQSGRPASDGEPTEGDRSPTTAEVTSGDGLDAPAQGDPDDPNDPAFYRVEGPAAGADCPLTA